MAWRRRDDYFIEDDAGCRISKQFHGVAVDYTAWVPGPPKNPYARVGYEAIGYFRGEDALARAKEAIGRWREVR